MRPRYILFLVLYLMFCFLFPLPFKYAYFFPYRKAHWRTQYKACKIWNRYTYPIQWCESKSPALHKLYKWQDDQIKKVLKKRGIYVSF